MKELATILIKTKRGYVNNIKEWSVRGGRSVGSGLWASPKLLVFECTKEFLDLFTHSGIFIPTGHICKQSNRFKLRLNRKQWLVTHHRFR